MKAHRLIALALTMVALALAACAPASGGTPAPTVTPKVHHAGQSAQQIVAGLKAKGLPIGEMFAFTAESDQNHLLGRPHQYVGKVSWRDTRVNESDSHGADISASDGGSVEVFANLADAEARAHYVETIAAGGGIFSEYDYSDGTVLLRVSKDLTPDQAKAYQTALLSLP